MDWEGVKMPYCYYCGRETGEEFYSCPSCNATYCARCGEGPLNYRCIRCGDLLSPTIFHVEKPYIMEREPAPHYPERVYPSARGIFRFSKTEIVQIIIALAALTFAFSYRPWRPLSLRVVKIIFPGLLTGFLFHELGHKFMAQKFGYWAEFRMSPLGILFTILSAIAGFIVFAAPGAVVIFAGSPTPDDKRKYGLISAAGPTVNLIMFLLFSVVKMYSWVGSSYYLIGKYGALINASLGLFNLLPFWVLDGAKVVKWSWKIWLLMFLIGVLEVYYVYS